MKSTDHLWKEIDDAVVNGFIYQMEEISQKTSMSGPTMYGTRIWFNGRVTVDQCEKVANYIRNTYRMKVDQYLPFSLTIWNSVHRDDDEE